MAEVDTVAWVWVLVTWQREAGVSQTQTVRGTQLSKLPYITMVIISKHTATVLQPSFRTNFPVCGILILLFEELTLRDAIICVWIGKFLRILDLAWNINNGFRKLMGFKEIPSVYSRGYWFFCSKNSPYMWCTNMHEYASFLRILDVVVS